jgi:hypothetical protein
LTKRRLVARQGLGPRFERRGGRLTLGDGLAGPARLIWVMDKKIDHLEKGWTWGRGPFANAGELAAQLAREIAMPLAPLTRMGKSMLEADATQAWMKEQGWIPESISDAGYFWRVKREGFAAHMAPLEDDVERLWSAMLTMAAREEAQELAASVSAAKSGRKKKQSPRI